MATALGDGATSIAATAGSVTGTAPLIVRQRVASVTRADPGTIAVGTFLDLQATARDAAGNLMPDPAVTWESSDDAVLRMLPGGRAHAIAIGASDISASVDGGAGTLTMSVGAQVVRRDGNLTEAIVKVIEGARGWVTNRPKQRKMFEAHGMLWLFYTDGRRMKYMTSRDRAEWSSPTIVRPAGLRSSFRILVR